MRILGMEISRRKQVSGAMRPVDSGRGWWPLFVKEPYAGAWQNDDEMRAEDLLAFHAVYACITLIASDIGKLRYKLVQLGNSGVWSETSNPAYSPVLRTPNSFQNHIQFKEYWLISKLSRGNAYIFKGRDGRGVVTSLTVLDPCRVLPLVAPDGSVFYQLNEDNLAGISESAITVPASEIIHDRMNCLYHPLVGISPLYACALAAKQGQSIQRNSSAFFKNMSQPGGMLTAPGSISQETAERLQQKWQENYAGKNNGRIAVAGDGLTFTPFAMKATDSQLIEQLKWTADVVCSTFHVPPYKIGIGQAPTFNNIESLQQDYYSTCLQTLIEAMEQCLDDGLALGNALGIEIDLSGLLRMDTATRYKAASDAIAGGWLAPNEARRNEGLQPVAGGDSPMLQQQNFSLEALAKRDALANPFLVDQPTTVPTPGDDDAEANTERALAHLFAKSPELIHVQH